MCIEKKAEAGNHSPSAVLSVHGLRYANGGLCHQPFLILVAYGGLWRCEGLAGQYTVSFPASEIKSYTYTTPLFYQTTSLNDTNRPIDGKSLKRNNSNIKNN